MSANEKEIVRRIQEARLDPSPKCWWWLSFADGSLPKGQQFLGVAIVEGANVYQAAVRARALGCNPGGSVLGEALDDDEIPSPAYANRLLSPSEITEMESGERER